MVDQLDILFLIEYQQIYRQVQEYRLVIAEQIVEVGDILVGDGVPADLIIAEFDQVTLVDGVGRVGKDNCAFTEDRDGVGEVADVIDIMGDPEYRETALLMPVEQGDDLHLIIGVKAVENLIKDEQARVERELEYNTQSNAFGLRQVAYVGVCRDVEAAVFENALDPAAQAFAVDVEEVGQRAAGDQKVLHDAEVLEQVKVLVDIDDTVTAGAGEAPAVLEIAVDGDHPAGRGE